MYPEPPNAEQIALALGAGTSNGGQSGPSFHTLRQSILTNKGIIHPIIVNRKQDETVIVIEGNTRVQIYREFQDRGVIGDWTTIPAIIYCELRPDQIDAIRLQAHLVGVRQWDPYSKAKYLNHLSKQNHLTLDQIVDYCGGDKREVTNYIAAFNDMEKYYAQVIDSDQDFDPTRFSAFVELQSPRVSTSLRDAGFTKVDFARWVHEKRLYPLNTVRKLPQILSNSESQKVFLKSNAQDAIRILDIQRSDTTLHDATIPALAKELVRRINSITYEQLQYLKQCPYSDEVEALQDLQETITLFCEDVHAGEQ